MTWHDTRWDDVTVCSRCCRPTVERTPNFLRLNCELHSMRLRWQYFSFTSHPRSEGRGSEPWLLHIHVRQSSRYVLQSKCFLFVHFCATSLTHCHPLPRHGQHNRILDDALGDAVHRHPHSEQVQRPLGLEIREEPHIQRILPGA